MNRNVKNKMAMYKALKTVLTLNQANWTPLTAFGSAVQTFSLRLDALEHSGYEQNLALIGVSAVKNAKKAVVVDKAFALSSAMIAFSVVNGDVELMNQMKIAKHKLATANRVSILVLVDRIIARGTHYVGQLGDYGINQASIDELQLLRDELNQQMNAPRNAIIDRKGETARIKTLTSEIDSIIKLQLDKLMMVLKSDFPDFYINYKNARIVVDTSHRINDNPGNTSFLPPPLNP